MSKKCENFIFGINELVNLVKKLPKNGIIILKGNLASGKTTLVKEIAKFHGFDGIVILQLLALCKIIDVKI